MVLQYGWRLELSYMMQAGTCSLAAGSTDADRFSALGRGMPPRGLRRGFAAGLSHVAPARQRPARPVSGGYSLFLAGGALPMVQAMRSSGATNVTSTCTAASCIALNWLRV